MLERIGHRTKFVGCPMSGNVIPFRKRPPSNNEMECYRMITRHWHPQVRALMCPEHFKRETAKEPSPSVRDKR